MSDEEFEDKELALQMVTEHDPPTKRALKQPPRPPAPLPFLYEEPTVTPLPLSQVFSAQQETSFIPIPKHDKIHLAQAKLRLRRFPVVRVLRKCSCLHRKHAFTDDPNQIQFAPVIRDEPQENKN